MFSLNVRPISCLQQWTFKPMVFPAFQYGSFQFRNMAVTPTHSSPNTTLLHRLAAVNHLSFVLRAQFCFSVLRICSSHFLACVEVFLEVRTERGARSRQWVMCDGCGMALMDCVVGLWRAWMWKIGGEGRRVDSSCLVIRYCGTLHQYVSCSQEKLSMMWLMIYSRINGTRFWAVINYGGSVLSLALLIFKMTRLMAIITPVFVSGFV